MKNKIIIIGSGFSSLASSCYLAKLGYSVTILEKNSSIGGRARVFKKDGFKLTSTQLKFFNKWKYKEFSKPDYNWYFAHCC